jgi:hypothetical protein
LHNGEHAVHHALGREVRAEFLLVEIVKGAALLFGPVANVPGLQLLVGECSISLGGE